MATIATPPLTAEVLAKHNAGQNVTVRSMRHTPPILSHANLESQKNTNGVKREAFQMHEQETYFFLNKPARDMEIRHFMALPPVDTTQLDAFASSERLLASIVRGYLSGPPSEEPPMKKFCTMNSIDDNFPLRAKEAMSKMGLDVGSLETIDKRADAATEAAVLELALDFDSAEAESEPAIGGMDLLVDVDENIEEVFVRPSYHRSAAAGSADTRVRRIPRVRRMEDKAGH